MKTAAFIRKAGDIKTLKEANEDALPWQRRKFEIEETITLFGAEYDEFKNNLYDDQDFIEKHKDLMTAGRDGTWHCLLVRQEGSTDGILVQSEGYDYPRYAAYYTDEGGPEEREITRQQLRAAHAVEIEAHKEKLKNQQEEPTDALREAAEGMRKLQEAKRQQEEIDAAATTVIAGSINHRPDLDTMRNLINAKIVRINMTQEETELILLDTKGNYSKIKLDRKF